MFRWKKMSGIVFLVVFAIAMTASAVLSAQDVEKYIPDTDTADQGMTLWQTILSGGWVMIVLAFLSVAALGLIIYYFMAMNPEKLLPEDFLKKSITLIEENRVNEVKIMCERKHNLVAGVLNAGLTHMDRDKIIINEAIESEGRRSTDMLWQRLSYLADIAAISPMVGLLGTVLGMIQAFNVIAFQTGAVKPILLASGISKAMITTATGLIVAIPAMIFYSFFRGRVQDVTARLENISGELCQIISEKGKK